jgi:hypothetical protein
VNEARNRIGMALDAETHGDVPTYAKPSLACPAHLWSARLPVMPVELVPQTSFSSAVSTMPRSPSMPLRMSTSSVAK